MTCFYSLRTERYTGLRHCLYLSLRLMPPCLWSCAALPSRNKRIQVHTSCPASVWRLTALLMSLKHMLNWVEMATYFQGKMILHQNEKDAASHQPKYYCRKQRVMKIGKSCKQTFFLFSNQRSVRLAFSQK